MSAMFLLTIIAIICGAAHGAVPADEVKSLPGFPSDFPFDVYSGFLQVQFNPPINSYTSAKIHYQFQTSRNDSKNDPVVAWHTGGPGGSSIYGQYAEVGYFQVSTSSGETVNENSWNSVANMLFLESPAGSFLTPVDQSSGFSICYINGVPQDVCSWDDRTQAQAYGHTLRAFFAAFPEFSKNELYLAGESYAGQYIPNIAAELLDNFADLNLKGIAVGNGCWGGDEDTVTCNGSNEDRDDVAFYFGKGLISQKLHDSIQAACSFSTGGSNSDECDAQLNAMDAAVGPHNVYNIYDNCPNLDASRSMRAWSERSGKSMRFARRFLSRNFGSPDAFAKLDAMAGVSVSADGVGNPPSGGGFVWTCGQFDALPLYFKRADVRAALNLPNKTGSTFSYNSSGPASVTLYPKLIPKIKVLIYNGDSDTCVPYIGNEEWTTSMVEEGVVEETVAWHPWFTSPGDSSPAGYATSYSHDFQFLTIRLAGHQVPKDMPEAALAIIKGFLGGKTF